MNKRLYYIITITNRVMGSKHFLDFYRAFGAPVVFTALGRGTASDDVLSYLGLEATEKAVLFSVVTPQVKDVLMRELVDTMHIDRPGSGIAVCLHLSSVGGMSTMNYLISGGADVQPDLTVKEEELMHDSGYELVVAIANGGYLVTPYVVDSISDKDGNIISQTETNIRRQVISEDVSRQLLAMMENNVRGAGDYHSCANAYVAGYRIGGKSGTAERTDRHLRGDGDYYKMMSFAAVLPIDDPEIEVFVLLDDPRWVKDYASQVVAPVVGNIISEIAPYLGIEQDADYNPTGTVTVQTCLDYTWTNAQVTLNRLGLKHKLIGPSSGNIVYQYPVGGSVVPAGSTIYLYTATDQNSMTTTPDVVGKTGTFAEQMLKAANLNVQFAGDSSGKVVAQDVEAGTSAAYGTIITLTMDSGEDTTNDAPTVTEEIDPANEEG